MGWGFDFAPYVPVAQRRANAMKEAARRAKAQKRDPAPVVVEGRKFAKTFWGLSWCQNLEAYSDYASRLPKGATYVRNGSVVDLVISSRKIEAVVAGSETYDVEIRIDPLPKGTWKKIKEDCSASIESLLDLLAGKFSEGVMQRLTRQKDGLFPSPEEIKLSCSCPDAARCCKHVAAVMYGVGNRLDHQPELLFLLRDVDHQELVSQAVAAGNLDRELTQGNENTLAGTDLSELFGIEIEQSDVFESAVSPTQTKPKRGRKPTTQETRKPRTPRARTPRKTPKT